MASPSEPAQSAPPVGQDSRRDALARLTPLGWNGGLALILALLAVSFFLAGYFVIYWRNADMDFMIVYNALAMNDGKQQLFFDHPSYFTILSTKAWFELMHRLGLLDAWKLSSIPSALNLPAFDAAMTSAVRAGRVVAWLTASAFVLIFAALARRLFQDWRIALLATFAFAFSGGIAVHMRILRSELIAACFFAFALMILMIVARQASKWRPLAIAAAAALCVLGMQNKIQIVLLIGALPVLMLPFGSKDSASVAFWRNAKAAWIAAFIAGCAAVLAVVLARPLIAAGLDRIAIEAAAMQPFLLLGFGIYQPALVALILIGMAVYAVIWKVSPAETVASMFAVIGGASLGLLTLYLRYDVQNAVAVINPIEKMLIFADRPVTSAVDGGGILSTIGFLVDGVIFVLKRYSFFLLTSPRPTVFLTWLIVPGIVYAWIRNERQVAIQALLLLLFAIGVDALGVRRGLKSEYFILTDPLIIIAAALLLDRMSDLRFTKWAYPIGVALIAAHVTISQAEPVKHVFKRSGPEYICEWNEYYEPELPLPWCDKPAKQP